MRNAPEKPTQINSAADIAVEIERLSSLSLGDLRAAWAAEFRREPPKGLQEKAFGGHDKATLKLLEGSGQKRAGDERCRRLKIGTVLIRDFGGNRHTVTIVPEGFIWQEKTYPSLTAIARIITGTNWNGPRFFGLREGEGGKDSRKQGKAA
jgi:hypothetical protein